MLALILLSVSSCAILVQDIRRRLIHLAWIILLGISMITINLYAYKYLLSVAIINLIFLILFFFILWSYIKIRKGWNEKMLNRYIGSGDILLLLALCAGYCLYNYIVLILSASILSLVFLGIVRLFRRTMIRIPFGASLVIVNYFLVILFRLTLLNPYSELFK